VDATSRLPSSFLTDNHIPFYLIFVLTRHFFDFFFLSPPFHSESSAFCLPTAPYLLLLTFISIDLLLLLAFLIMIIRFFFFLLFSLLYFFLLLFNTQFSFWG